MVKEKTAALECAKKASVMTKRKKTARGSLSRSALLPGWIQEDWTRSTVSQEDLESLAHDGLIKHGSWRLPGILSATTVSATLWMLTSIVAMRKLQRCHLSSRYESMTAFVFC